MSVKIYRLLPLLTLLAVLSLSLADARPAEANDRKMTVPGRLNDIRDDLSKSRDGGRKVAFRYEADFEMYFDNREYNTNSPYLSKTIFGASVAPRIGFSVNRKHSVMAGAEIQKQFGGKFSNILDGISLYYNYDDGNHRLYAGVFPREKMAGEYSEAFFSDSLNFFRQVIQGLLYNYEGKTKTGWNINVEAGIDWMGQYSDTERERFMILSAGEFSTKIFTIGYNAYVYHFASSEAVHGVMDNILVYPYFKADFGQMLGIQEFSLRGGWLQSMQNDRKHGNGYLFPGGGEFSFVVRHWNVRLENKVYAGGDLMPFYDMTDDIGVQYGNSLYFGDRYYSVGSGFYDRLELSYEPRITDFLSVKVSAIAHFYNKYCGWQQMVTIKMSF
ncbi:MAG: hypothetical protein IAC87_02020 [Muribaculum sp.]|uniref:Uncharacterized protein n=1 Tax=Candidatus Merdivivens faecigallinarum TaxID=2840871 RepID=A0A9D9NPS9_9BACT|nr:hypothetical protein [Candidatus Merdivivens faecigallinarum]